MAKLIMMMGVPGVGKSTYVKKHIKDNQLWVSRDIIRFQLVSEDEEYFSKEKEVFKTFIDAINTGLAEGKDVYADATHLSKKARAKVLRKVKGQDSTAVIWIKKDLSKALEYNQLRSGREVVPESVVTSMFDALTKPTKEEGFDAIIVIDETGYEGVFYHE